MIPSASSDVVDAAELEAIYAALGRLAEAPPCPAQTIFGQLLRYLLATVVNQPLCNIAFSKPASFVLIDVTLTMSRPRAGKAVRFLVALQRALMRLAVGHGLSAIPVHDTPRRAGQVNRFSISMISPGAAPPGRRQPLLSTKRNGHRLTLAAKSHPAVHERSING